jgi:hypothetical protein
MSNWNEGYVEHATTHCWALERERYIMILWELALGYGKTWFIGQGWAEINVFAGTDPWPGSLLVMD